MTTSILIPVYNQEKYIGRAIRSALSNCLFSNVEVVVINDGSTDSTQSVIDSFSGQVRSFSFPVNRGLPYALNHGIRKSTGKYILRLDGDDWLHDRTVDIMSFHLDSNNLLDSVSCDYYLVDDRQNKVEHVSHRDHPIGCAIMFRREHLFDIGLYDPSMRCHEDKEIMSRYLDLYQIYHIPLPLYRYHIHGSNMTLDSRLMSTYQDILRLRGKNHL